MVPSLVYRVISNTPAGSRATCSGPLLISVNRAAGWSGWFSEFDEYGFSLLRGPPEAILAGSGSIARQLNVRPRPEHFSCPGSRRRRHRL